MKKLLVFLTGLILILFVSTNVWCAPYTGADIMLNGTDYIDISDRWSEDGTSIYTNWDNEWATYQADLTAGFWNFGLNAKNRGDLGENWYANFVIQGQTNAINYNFTIYIPASDSEEYNGFVTLNLFDADTYTVRYEWMNDAYNPPLDANIEITSVFFDNTETTAPVPEPATMLLFGIGLLGLAGVSRRKK